MYTPELWRMADYLGRDDLKRLAAAEFERMGVDLDQVR